MSNGLFEKGRSYSAVQIAEMLGHQQAEWKQVRWVESEVFGKGCPHRTIGNVHVATGDSLNAWIDSTDSEASDPAPVDPAPPDSEAARREADGRAAFRREAGSAAPPGLPFITARSLADQLGVSKRTVMSHFVRQPSPGENGRPCPHIKIGAEVYFVVDRVKEWLDEQTAGVADSKSSEHDATRVDAAHNTANPVAAG